ncbi:class I SAM-dependent methyltransferase [Campylobacter lari]|nr:class I SAM-dependent methyltransferase [Campylobacter lari]
MKQIERSKCPITNSENIEILSNRKFPLFCGCTTENSESDLIYEEEFAICKDSGVLFLNKLIPLDVLYKNGHYAGSVGKIWEEHHEAFANFIFQVKPRNVLEVGGGHGKLAQNFLKLQKTNWTIVEPDTKNKFSNVNYIDGFFDKNICKDKQYDVIVHSHTFEHIYNPNEFLNDISDSLNGGGYMIFSLPNMQKWLECKFGNCINFEHTIFLNENLIEYLLYKNKFQIIVKKYFKDHSIFYLTKKSESQKNIELKNDYEENKKLFLDMKEYYKNEVKKLNQLIKETAKEIYLFGAHLFSQNLIYNGLDVSKIKYILDNDTNKQEKRLYGTNLYVKSPQILKNNDNVLVILNAGVYSDEIKDGILNDINSNVEVVLC